MYIHSYVYSTIHINYYIEDINLLPTSSLFHKTLPISSIQMYWISVKFYDLGVRNYWV